MKSSSLKQSIKQIPQQQKGINYALQGRKGKITNPDLIGFDSKRVFKPIELKKYEDTFKYFDRSGVGLIKKEDFGFAIRSMGFVVTTIELRDLGQFLDDKKTNQFSLYQFLCGVYLVRNRKPDQNEINKSLKVFEKNGTGKINIQEFKQILMTLGDIVNITEFESVIAELDIENGEIKLDDLQQLLMIPIQY